MTIWRLLPLGALITLMGCSGSIGVASAPTECPQDEFLSAIQQYVDGSSYTETDWQPTPGSDLEAALKAGGVACTYGPGEAEVGATVLWAEGADLFAERSAQWEADGQTRVNVDGASEAWALVEETETERVLWAINLLVDDVWIQVDATFLSDIEEARELVAAAIDVAKGN